MRASARTPNTTYAAPYGRAAQATPHLAEQRNRAKNERTTRRTPSATRAASTAVDHASATRRPPLRAASVPRPLCSEPASHVGRGRRVAAGALGRERDDEREAHVAREDGVGHGHLLAVRNELRERLRQVRPRRLPPRRERERTRGGGGGQGGAVSPRAPPGVRASRVRRVRGRERTRWRRQERAMAHREPQTARSASRTPSRTLRARTAHIASQPFDRSALLNARLRAESYSPLPTLTPPLPSSSASERSARAAPSRPAPRASRLAPRPSFEGAPRTFSSSGGFCM